MPTGEMDIASMLSNALVKRLGSSPASLDTTSVANALGSNEGAASPLGVADTNQLFGLNPDEINNIAKTRSNISYQNMLGNIGALDFAQKLKGIPEQRQFENQAGIEGFKGQVSMAENAATNAMHLKAAQIAADAHIAGIKSQLQEPTSDKFKASLSKKVYDAVNSGHPEKVKMLDLIGSNLGDTIKLADAADESRQAYKSSIEASFPGTDQASVRAMLMGQFEEKVKAAQGQSTAIKSMFPHLYNTEPAPAKGGAAETYTNPHGVTFELKPGADRNKAESWVQKGK